MRAGKSGRTEGRGPAACDDPPSDFVAVLLARAAAADARKTERTRSRLLASLAAELRAGVRPSGLTVAAITAGAGLAHGTFYRYFADTDAAAEALIGDFCTFVQDRLAATRDGGTGSRERVRGTTLAYTRLFRENAALMRCMIEVGAGSTAFSASFQALNRTWNMRTAAAIARRRALSPTGEAAAAMLPAAYALGGMVDEFLTQIYLRRDPALAHMADDEAAVADLLAGLWWRAAGCGEEG